MPGGCQVIPCQAARRSVPGGAPGYPSAGRSTRLSHAPGWSTRLSHAGRSAGLSHARRSAGCDSHAGWWRGLSHAGRRAGLPNAGCCSRCESDGYSRHRFSGASPGTTAPPEPKTLRDFVRLALSEGRDHDAYQLLLLGRNRQREIVGKHGWFPGIRHNSPAIRFGIGIVYTGLRAVSSPEPIGHGGASGGAAGAMGAWHEPTWHPIWPADRAGPVVSKAAALGNEIKEEAVHNRTPINNKPNLSCSTCPTEPAAMLAFYTGELGDKVLKNLRKRFDKGDFGTDMKDSSKARPAAVAAGPGGFRHDDARRYSWRSWTTGRDGAAGRDGPGHDAGRWIPRLQAERRRRRRRTATNYSPASPCSEKASSPNCSRWPRRGVDVLIIYDIEVARGTSALSIRRKS